MPHAALQREILRPLWKVHILHHAQEAPIVGHWMLEELREHGYRMAAYDQSELTQREFARQEGASGGMKGS